MAAPRSGGSPSSSYSHSASASAIPAPSPSLPTVSRARTVTATASGPSIPTPQQLRRASSGASTKLIRRVNTQDRISDILEVCALVHYTFCLLPSRLFCQRQEGCWIIPVWQWIATGSSVTCPLQRPSHDTAMDATTLLVFLNCYFDLLVPSLFAYSTLHAHPPTPVTDMQTRARSWAVNAPRVCRRLEARQPSSAGAAAATTNSRSRRSRTRQRRSSRAPPVVVPPQP